MVTKPLNVNHQIYCQMLLEKVIPAIKNRFPHHHNRTVSIQQDGAGAHILSNDEQFLQQLDQIRGIWNFKLITQPARSLDLNHLDLSFFRALERSNSKKTFPSNIDELIANVEQTYWQFDPRAIEKGFVTLGCVCNEVICCQGDNTYKLPHVGKDAILHREGSLPLEIKASEDVFEIAREWETPDADVMEAV